MSRRLTLAYHGQQRLQPCTVQVGAPLLVALDGPLAALGIGRILPFWRDASLEEHVVAADGELTWQFDVVVTRPEVLDRVECHQRNRPLVPVLCFVGRLRYRDWQEWLG